jgi:hypothetical protein
MKLLMAVYVIRFIVALMDKTKATKVNKEDGDQYIKHTAQFRLR